MCPVLYARLSMLWLELCLILGWLRCFQAVSPALRMLSLMQRPWVRLAHLQSMRLIAECFASQEENADCQRQGKLLNKL